MATIVKDSFTKQKDYWAVGLTHFSADALTSGRNLVVAVLALSIGLSNSQVAIAALLYNVGNALTQPFFGLLADKVGPRLLVVGGILWMIVFGALAAVAGDWPALIAITVMGLGSGAIHPAGTMVAGQVRHDQRTRATALFFVMGQMGLFAGPILAGVFMDVWQRPGYLAMSLIALTALASSWQWVINRWEFINGQQVEQESVQSAPAAQKPTYKVSYILPLALAIVHYATISNTVMTFMPKLFAELGYEISFVGWLTGIFLLGMAGGGYLGGLLGDKFNGRLVIIGSMTATIVPLYLAIPAPPVWQMVLLGLAGLVGGMPHSIFVITVQNLLPGRRATASGIVLGSMFFGASIGTYIIGLIADQIGLALALQGMALLPLIAAVMTGMIYWQERQAVAESV